MRIRVTSSLDKSSTDVLLGQKSPGKQNAKIRKSQKKNVISQIKLIQNKIQKSKDVMQRQINSQTIGYGSKLKLN